MIRAETLYAGIVNAMSLAVAYVRGPVPCRSVNGPTLAPEAPFESSRTNCTHAHGATSAVSPTNGSRPLVTELTCRISTRARAMFRVSGTPIEPKNEGRLRSLTRTSTQ